MSEKGKTCPNYWTNTINFYHSERPGKKSLLKNDKTLTLTMTAPSF